MILRPSHPQLSPDYKDARPPWAIALRLGEYFILLAGMVVAAATIESALQTEDKDWSIIAFVAGGWVAYAIIFLLLQMYIR